MKKILVVSDDHNDLEKLKKLYQMYPNFDLYLHAGDSQNIEQNLFPFVTVKGNNDYYIDTLSRVISIEGHKIFLTHGHKNVLNKAVMSEVCLNKGCDIYIHGHTHCPYYEQINGVHLLCPGSLNYPRSSFGESYAIITLDKDIVNVEIKRYK